MCIREIQIYQEMGSGMVMNMYSGELHITDSGFHSFFDKDKDDWNY